MTTTKNIKRFAVLYTKKPARGEPVTHYWAEPADAAVGHWSTEPADAAAFTFEDAGKAFDGLCHKHRNHPAILDTLAVRPHPTTNQAD